MNNCCENTITNRVKVLTCFSRAHPSFPNVTPMQVTAWLGRPGFSVWSRAAYYGHLRSFYTYAMENDLIAVDPMARMRRPRGGKCVPRPLTPEQVAVVLAAASPNMRTWLVLGLYAGLRAHEIAKLRGEDIDARDLFVLGKGGKGEHVPTHPMVWAEAQRRPRTGYWFPSPRAAAGHVTSMSISTMTSRLFTAHGIEGSIHRMRHTFATDLLRAGVNVRVVQTLMRHESLESTMIYTAVDEVELRDAINLLSAA